MASLADWPTTPYLNPFFNALFFTPDPSPAVKKLRLYLSEPSRFTRNVLVAPPCKLIWAIDAETRQSFWDLIHTSEDFLASHVLIIPPGPKYGDRSRRMLTFNNKTTFAYKNYIQTNAGFKIQLKSRIVREFIYTPASPYLPTDTQFLVYEVAYPLVGKPSYPLMCTGLPSDPNEKQNLNSLGFASNSNPLNALTNNQSSFSSSNGTSMFQNSSQSQNDLDEKILEPPIYLGIDQEKLKADVRVCRDYKLLQIIYIDDISRIDPELLRLINNFSVDRIDTREALIEHYNHTIDEAISIFSSMGSNTLNKIMAETDLSSQELGQMVGEHIEYQLHVRLWEKTKQLFQKQDSKISDLCWAIKNISIEQLGIPINNVTLLFDLDDLVNQSVKLFSSLSTIIGAGDKIKVLLSVIQILSNGTPNAADKEALQRVTKCSVHYNLELNNDSNYNRLKNIMSADILVSLMILVVVRSDMVNINSLLFYLRSFSFSDTEMGHIGYALSTLEAVAYHIESNYKKMASLSKLNKKFWSSLNAASQLETENDENESNKEQPACDTSNEESPAVTEITKQIRHLIASQPENWISVVRSRSPLGVSSLVNCISDIRRQNPVVSLELFDFFLDLIDPQTGKFIFDTDYVIGDRDASGFTLFLLALESEDENFIFSVLSKIDELDNTQMAKYFTRVNNWRRSVGHYIFYAHELIPEIGHLIDWEIKDLAGQTPLFALIRCYDHQKYDQLVETSFRAWEKQSIAKNKSPKQSLDLMIHRDPKDNTLLHIVKDAKALRMLLQYSVDTNWPNELGFTPLMTYAKYSRLGAIIVLLNDSRVDIHIQNEGGATALEIAKDTDTIRYLESANILYVDKKALQNSGYHHSSSILHTSLSKSRLYFIITSGIPFDPISLTSVRRTFEDFKFLAKWLGYENPYSWVPPIETLVGPKILHGRTVYQLFHDVQIRLNVFLRALIMHPTFANHELLWEFVLVQDIEKESVIERCRRKLQNQQEHQMEKEEWWGSSFYGTTGKSRSSSVSNQGSNNSSEKSQKHQSSSSGAKESFNSGRRVSLASSLSSINDEAAKVLNPIKTVTKKVSISNFLGNLAKNGNNHLNTSLDNVPHVSSHSDSISSSLKPQNELDLPMPPPIPIAASSSGTNYSLALPKSPTTNFHPGTHSRSVSVSSVQSASSSTSTSGLFFFRGSDLEPIQYFIQYAHDQLSKLAESTERMCSGMQRITVAVDSYNEAVKMASEISNKTPAFGEALLHSLRPQALKSIGNKKTDWSASSEKPIDFQHLQKASLLGMLFPITSYSEFAIGLNALSTIVNSAVATLATPISLIEQLKEREATLNTLHRTLEKASGKNAWPLGIFEEKRVKDINDVNDKIYLCQNEINRISTDIHRYHETLASEVGALYTIHEEELKLQIGRFVERIIKDRKTNLIRLLEVQNVIGIPKKSSKAQWVGVSKHSSLNFATNLSQSDFVDTIFDSSEKDDLSVDPTDDANEGSTIIDIDSQIDLPWLVANSTKNIPVESFPSIQEDFEEGNVPSIEITKHFSDDDLEESVMHKIHSTEAEGVENNNPATQVIRPKALFDLDGEEMNSFDTSNSSKDDDDFDDSN